MLSLRSALRAAAACLATAATPAVAHAAAPPDEALLAAIQQQAPSTVAIAEVSPAPDAAHLAIRTRAQAADESTGHDELWLSAGDGTGLSPLSQSTGSGAAYAAINAVGWSADGRSLAYAYVNPAVKSATTAHVITVGGTSMTDQQLGPDTSAPEFTADGRYVTFLQSSGGLPRGSGALDLASGTILLPARVDYLGADGAPVTAPWISDAYCARAKQPGWTPARASGRWLEQALSSPDPGCRFGANAGDPGPTPAAAQDAPASITKAVGANLVTIADRTKPLGPTLRIRSSAKSLAGALRRGLRVQIDLAGARTVKAYVLAERPAGEDEDVITLSGETRVFTLGRASFRDLPSQSQVMTIPLTREAKRMLPRFLKITVTVRIVAVDKAGNRTTVERDVALTDF